MATPVNGQHNRRFWLIIEPICWLDFKRRESQAAKVH
jgi:hypothetical protein